MVSATICAQPVIESLSLAQGTWGSGEGIWDQIVGRMPTASPYLSTTWTRTWIETFGPVLKPVQLIIRDDRGHPIGTCLLTRRVRWSAGLPHVRIHVNTDGEAAQDSVVIEHNAVLAIPGAEDAVARATAAHIMRLRVDEVRMSGADDSEVSRLSCALDGWSVDVEWRDSPFVDLNMLRSSGKHHAETLSKNTREQLRRSMSLYGERGPVQLDAAKSADDAESMFSELIALHDFRWRSVGHAGGFATPRRREFHRAFIRAGVKSGNAQLLKVTAGGETIGVLYNLVANGRVNFYQSGLRYESNGHLKPGLVAHHMAITHCLAEGMSEYDFLPSSSGEGRYKSSLSNSSRRLAALTLIRRGWRTDFFNIARAVRHAIKSTRAVAVPGRSARAHVRGEPTA